MPRAHTPEERERIRLRLLDAGQQAFGRNGLAKVSIDELARAAGIGKGSFYHFFASKEALFLAIQEQQEAVFRESLRQELERAGSGRAAIEALLRAAATRLQAHPFLRLLLEPETLAALTLRLPAEQLAAHRQADRAYFLKLLRSWKRRGWLRESVDPRTVFDTVTAMFLLSTQRELLGDDAMRRVVGELAEGLAERWCAG